MNAEQLTENIINATAGFWNKIAAFLPNLMAALLILMVGILIAKLLTGGVVKLLNRLGFNNLCDRIGLSAAISKAGVQKTPAEVVGKFIYVFMLLVIFISTAETLGLQRITVILDDFILYLPKVLGALFVVMVGMFIAHVAKQSIQTAISNMGMEYASSVARIAQIIIFATTFSLAVGQLEIETRMLNMVFGILLGCIGIAAAISLGLGTRSVSNNILSGVYVREQLKPGDQVMVGDFSGVVVSVGTVNTVLENAQGECLSVPNQQLLQRSFRFRSWSDDED